MALIQIEHLTFGYDGSYDLVFEDLTLQIDTGWRLGLVGRNGRGKTTLLRLLRGEYEYSGKLSAPVEFAYFPYEVPDGSRTTAAVLEGLCPNTQEWEFRRELSLLQVPEEVLERAFDTLSNGERTKVLLAALFLEEHRFPLIDEPTNHLDAEGRALVGAYLKSKPGFLLVSHDRAVLDLCTDHILAINRADVEVQRGNFSGWLQERERRDAAELAENERLRREMKRLGESARRASDWSDKTERGKYGTDNSGSSLDRGYVGHKAAKMMKRSKAIEGRRTEAAEAKAALLKNIETAEPLKLTCLTHHAKRLVSLDEVAVFYGAHQACAAACFQIEQGERVSLCGGNGTGKSSLIKLICGEPLEYTGTLHRAGGMEISYVPQDTSGLAGSMEGFVEARALDGNLFRAILRKLGFERTQFEKDLRELSAGQKKKVLIAASLCRGAHLYVWDEPLNYIDVISRLQIERLLLEFQPTLLFVEHDAAFRQAVATREIQLI